MSFGVGVGDIITITKIGFKLWVNFRGAKKEREDLAANLMEWRDKLKMLEVMLANAQLSPPAAKHAKGQLSEALLTLQILEVLNNKIVRGKAFRQAAWEVCGRAEFEKYQAGLKERVETINSLFLGGSMALVTDTVRENNVILKQVENGMKHMGFSPDHEPIRFIDALNGQRLLPWEYCKTWEDFRSLVQMGFKESAGKSFVERGEYDIINEESGALLKMEEWGNIIKPGILLSMAIVIRKQMEKGKNDHRCPGCQTRYTGSVGIGNELERVKW
ncbi:hypothetical protein DFP73DRAFT_221937 [Morchella snyderi]|nr:hypothetical protein DFP73DRAFT_221937 [Morchella snyderi]